MSSFLTNEDGYFSLTKAGTTALYVLLIVLVLLIAFIRTSKKSDDKKSAISTKQLIFSAAAIAIAFVLSYIKLSMPWGGSVTLCSMLFITLIGYWYGPKVGLIAGLAYGLLQFIQDGGSYILSPLQVGFDYIFAFAALGASGFFKNKKNGLLVGYIVAILLRGLFHTIGGYLYWMDYMPDNFPKSLAVIYPICYNYLYILVEGVITVIVMSIPAVDKSIRRVTAIARD